MKKLNEKQIEQRKEFLKLATTLGVHEDTILKWMSDEKYLKTINALIAATN